MSSPTVICLLRKGVFARSISTAGTLHDRRGQFQAKATALNSGLYGVGLRTHEANVSAGKAVRCLFRYIKMRSDNSTDRGSPSDKDRSLWVKAATRGLRQDSGRDLRVTQVSPGFTDSEGIGEDRTPDDVEEMIRIRDAIAIPPSAIASVVGYAIGQTAGIDISEIVVRLTIQV